MTKEKARTSFFFGFFFISGFAALLYQIVWLKYLNLIFGSTTYATAAVLSAFFFGLAVGSKFCVKFSALFVRPLRSYGIAEMGVGLFALFFPILYSGFQYPFSWIFNAVGPQTFLYNFITFCIAFLVLLIPTSLMGATLPLLSDVLIRDTGVSQKTGLLYALNTAGAVSGVLVSAFVLIPAIGLHATISVGAFLNLLIGLICFLAGKREEPRASSPPHSLGKPDSFLYLYGISGLLAIAYEVLWTRILVLHLGSSVYAYAIMLSVFLLGISLGSYACGHWIAHRESRTEFLFGWIQIAWAFAILLQIWQFSKLSAVLGWLASLTPVLTATRQFFVLFVASLQILFLPTFLSGALFPLMVKRLWSQRIPIKDATSLSYSYNTVGGIFGSLIAGFVLVPLLGTQKALMLLAFSNLMVGMIASRQFQIFNRQSIVLFCAALLYLIFATIEQKEIHILESAGIFDMGKNEKLIHLEEDVAAAISVEQRDYMGEAFASLSVNGINVAGTSPNLVRIQKMQGHIPLILAGPTRPKSVLHIGFGSGGTAYAVSLYPNTNITVVELSHGIVRNADAYFRSVNHGIVQSGKLKFIYFDGRSFLQNTSSNYDVILSDSIHPRYSGNGSLYTKDYYQLVYARLNPGGVHSQWIPFYSLTLKNLKEILKAFLDVFPNTYVWYINSTINPYIIVTGIKSPGDTGGISCKAIQSVYGIPDVAADLKQIGAGEEYSLLDHFLFGPKQLASFVADVGPHLDDLLSVEYESSRVLNRDASWKNNYIALASHREGIQAYLKDCSGSFDPAIYSRFYNATAFNLRGQAYFLARQNTQANQLFDQARRMNPEDRDPFEYYHFYLHQ